MTVTLFFRLSFSALLSAPLTLITVASLRAVGTWLGVDTLGGVVDTLLNTHAPWITTASDWIKAHPRWAPGTLIWVAWSLTIYGRWSARVAFLLNPRHDDRVLMPLDNGHLNVETIPWVDDGRTSAVDEIDLTVRPADLCTMDEGLQRQGFAIRALYSWVRTGDAAGLRNNVWLRKPDSRLGGGWVPLSLALVTGSNGIGKSSLAAEFARRLSRLPSARQGMPDDANWRKWSLRLEDVWTNIRLLLPGARRRRNDPWHVGALYMNDAGYASQLEAWEPKRPTLLIVDEPDHRLTQVINILEKRRHTFWFPVRLLVLDQQFPIALDEWLPSLVQEHPPIVHLEHGGALDLGNLQFNVGAIRSLWTGICGQLIRHVELLPLPTDDRGKEERRQDLEKIERRARKLWQGEALTMVLHVAEGNPLQIVLALAELATTDSEPDDWLDAVALPDVPLPSRQEDRLALFQASLMTALRSRQLDKRAADLYEGFRRVLQRRAPQAECDGLRMILAATVTGGGNVRSDMTKWWPKALWQDLFRGLGPGESGVWVPPVRPTKVAMALLDYALAQVADSKAAAADVGALAWQINPEGALRAAANGRHLPASLKQALVEAGRKRAQRLALAQAYAAGLLQLQVEAAELVDGVCALDDNELATLHVWLVARVVPDTPVAVSPLGALTASLIVGAECLSRKQFEPNVLREEIRRQAHWAELLGYMACPRSQTRKALSRALARFLVLWTRVLDDAGSTTATAEFTIWMYEVLTPLRSGETNLTSRLLVAWTRNAARRIEAMGRVAAEEPAVAGSIANWLALTAQAGSWRFGRLGLAMARHAAHQIDALPLSTPLIGRDPHFVHSQALAWRHAARAAAKLGGPEALQQCQAMAQRVEQVVTTRPEFATHPGIQMELATAWQCAARAAIKLSGPEALQQSQAMAQRVEQVAAARPEFGTHPGIQTELAMAWQYAAHAATKLGGLEALHQASAMAQHLEQVATTRPEFATHPGVQVQLAMAWRHATYAASKLGGPEALQRARAIAQHVEQVATARPEFATHPGIQRELATAWQCAAHAAAKLDGLEALHQASAMAQHVEQIVTARPEFATHLGMQRELALAWQWAAYAACKLGGPEALQQARAIAQHVEQIATARPEFANYPDIQIELALVWQCAAYAASQLGGPEALQQARAMAQHVEQVATTCPEFATHPGIQVQLAIAWRHTAYAATKLGGPEALQQSRAMAQHVEQVAVAHPEFATHPEIQMELATAWQWASYAASELGGPEALLQTQAMVQRVEQVATRPEFATHLGIQLQLAMAWRHAAYAAAKLSGPTAFQQARAMAQHVEQVAMAHPEFAIHPGIQVELAMAWQFVAYTASELGGPEALQQARVIAQHVEQVATARPEFATHPGIQVELAKAWQCAAYTASRSSEPSSNKELQLAASKLRAIANSAVGHDDAGIQSQWSEVLQWLVKRGLWYGAV